MDQLDVEGLSDVLKQHMPEEIVNMLKAQLLTGADFMSLTDNELVAFKFPLGYIKTINRVKALLLNDPSLVGSSGRGTSSAVSNHEDNSSNKYIPLLKYFTQENLDKYTDYEKDAFLKKLERYIAIFGDQGNPFQNVSSRPESPPSKRKKGQKGSRKQVESQKSTRSLRSAERNSKASTSHNASRNNEQDSESEESNFSDETHIQDNSDEDDEDEHNGESDKENENGREFLSTQITTLAKDSATLELLKPHLATLDVEEILLKDKVTKKYVPFLKACWLLTEKSRKRMFRVLMTHVCWKVKEHPNQVTVGIRDGLAKSIVVAYPQYQRPFDIKGKDPWSSVLLNLNNIMKRIQDKLPEEERARKGIKRKFKSKKMPVDCSVNVKTLAILNDDRSNKTTILDGMAATFAIRCNMRRDGESITVMLAEFPHFIHYKGEVLLEEFSRMYPQAQDMCPQLLDLCPKILEMWRKKILVPLPFEDDLLTSCAALANYLPHPVEPPEQGPRATRRRRQRGRKQGGRVAQQASASCATPVLEELIVIQPPHVNIPIFVQEKRAEANKPVQPYLMGIQSPLTKKILKYFLILDGGCVDLEAVPSVRALDLLFKSFFVFYVNYPPSWSLFFRFLQTCLYKIFESDSDEPPTSCVDTYRLLTSN